MTQSCGQTDPARSVVSERPPYDSARLDQTVSLALRHALPPDGRSDTTRALRTLRAGSGPEEGAHDAA